MTNAIFYIRSPFQMLCAINTLTEYHIDESKFIIIEDDNMRVSQIAEICNAYSLNFEIANFRSLVKGSFFKLLLQASLYDTKKFKYVFVGDFREYEVAIFSTRNLDTSSQFFFLDDGNITISYFSGITNVSLKSRLKNNILKFLVFLKSFKSIKYCTIFSDIKTDFCVTPNNLDIFSMRVANKTKDVYFIGTTPIDYCNEIGIVYDTYEKVLKNVLDTLKAEYPGQNYYYIPHGRDSVVERTKEICNKSGFTFMPVKECVEFFILKNKTMPLVCSGFGSTALFTIKKMSPSTICINNEFYGTNTNASEEYRVISNYYKKNDIIINQILQ